MKLKTATQPPAHVSWGMVSSPAGKLAVALTEKGEICRLSFLSANRLADILAAWQAAWPETKFTKAAPIKNIATKPILLTGTAFQQKVWRAMTKIPAGKAITYKEIAHRIGNPAAIRAVGGACGANPVPYLVPCHRVVAANGLGGYSGGPGVKEKLLKAEGYL